ncbi:MAG TPA: late competence development ComFB family protein [Spirochaetia bacterium]|nr:late competence development ComFB family protein [Spirochaetia bacterium]
MKLSERYNMDNMRNRAEEMVFEAIERTIGEDPEMCTCEECVLDLAAWTLNHVTPRYYISLLAPLRENQDARRKAQVEIELAINAGKKKLKKHPHHG